MLKPQPWLTDAAHTLANIATKVCELKVRGLMGAALSQGDYVVKRDICLTYALAADAAHPLVSGDDRVVVHTLNGRRSLTRTAAVVHSDPPSRPGNVILAAQCDSGAGITTPFPSARLTAINAGIFSLRSRRIFSSSDATARGATPPRIPSENILSAVRTFPSSLVPPIFKAGTADGSRRSPAAFRTLRYPSAHTSKYSVGGVA